MARRRAAPAGAAARRETGVRPRARAARGRASPPPGVGLHGTGAGRPPPPPQSLDGAGRVGAVGRRRGLQSLSARRIRLADPLVIGAGFAAADYSLRRMTIWSSSIVTATGRWPAQSSA